MTSGRSRVCALVTAAMLALGTGAAEAETTTILDSPCFSSRIRQCQAAQAPAFTGCLDRVMTDCQRTLEYVSKSELDAALAAQRVDLNKEFSSAVKAIEEVTGVERPAGTPSAQTGAEPASDQ
jgi:hypothetical protein